MLALSCKRRCLQETANSSLHPLSTTETSRSSSSVASSDRTADIPATPGKDSFKIQASSLNTDRYTIHMGSAAVKPGLWVTLAFLERQQRPGVVSQDISGYTRYAHWDKHVYILSFLLPTTSCWQIAHHPACGSLCTALCPSQVANEFNSKFHSERKQSLSPLLSPFTAV